MQQLTLSFGNRLPDITNQEQVEALSKDEVVEYLYDYRRRLNASEIIDEKAVFQKIINWLEEKLDDRILSRKITSDVLFGK